MAEDTMREGTGARGKVSTGAKLGRQTGAKLGLAAATSLVIGNMIGTGVFTLPASLAPFGGLALVGWIVTTGGTVLLALVFARLVGLARRVGGPYAYTRVGVGVFAGFWIARGYWIAIGDGNAASAVATVDYLATFYAPLGTNNLFGGTVAVAVVWITTAINCRGVQDAGAVQTGTTVIKVIPLVLVATLGLFSVDRQPRAARDR